MVFIIKERCQAKVDLMDSSTADFDLEIKDKKAMENLAADHLSHMVKEEDTFPLQ